jgi:hypothetical protein
MKALGIAGMFLAAASGCSRHELSGTRWSVVEFVEPDADDQRLIGEVDAMLVEFRPDGRLVTTTIYKDGRATVEDRERYRLDGECLKIQCATGAKVAMYRKEGEQLRIHSPRFVLVMNPVLPAAEHTRVEVTSDAN